MINNCLKSFDSQETFNQEQIQKMSVTITDAVLTEIKSVFSEMELEKTISAMK